MVALAKSPPESMKEMLLKAQKYMNAKDALAVIGMGDTQKEEKNAQEDSKGKKRETVHPAMTMLGQGATRREGR